MESELIINNYPKIRLSECKHHDINSMCIGARFCEKCNAIILFFPHCRKRFNEIEEDIVDILNHETLHWILLKENGEKACSDLDMISTYSEEYDEDWINL
jgi:hypothetical protein